MEDAIQADLSHYFTITEYGSTHGKVVFLFGGWRVKAITYSPIIRDLVKRGWKCVLFVPDTKLIAVGTPYAEIVNAAAVATQYVQGVTQQEHAQDQDARFLSFGISFGTIFATECAKHCPQITKLILASPFGDFAEHVTLWLNHRYFSRVLNSQPTSREESGTVLNQVGLHTRLDLLRGTRILICYANRDTVIHTQTTEQLIRMLRENDIETEVSRVRGGHVSGIFKHLYLARTYRRFLTDLPALKN